MILIHSIFAHRAHSDGKNCRLAEIDLIVLHEYWLNSKAAKVSL